MRTDEQIEIWRKYRQPVPKWLWVAAYLFFVGGGIFCLSTSGRWLYCWHDSEKWVPGNAIIDDVHVETVRSSGEHADHTSFRVHVQYHYQWHEQTYHGNRLTISQQPEDYSTSETWRKELDAARQTGSSIPVLINPKDPSMSVLIRQWESRYTLIGVAGILFVLAPNVALVLFWKYKHPQQRRMP